MAIKRQREIALTAVAIVVLAGAVLAYRLHTIAPAPAASAQPAAAPAANSTIPASKPAGLAELNLPALSAQRGELQETVRDPFRFKPKPPPPPAVMQPTPQPTAPVGPPPPPRIALKFFGSVETKKGPLAALSDSRGVYKGHVGDTIEGRYRILRIGVESIDLAYLDGRGKQTIRLSGQ